MKVLQTVTYTKPSQKKYLQTPTSVCVRLFTIVPPPDTEKRTGTAHGEGNGAAHRYRCTRHTTHTLPCLAHSVPKIRECCWRGIKVDLSGRPYRVWVDSFMQLLSTRYSTGQQGRDGRSMRTAPKERNAKRVKDLQREFESSHPIPGVWRIQMRERS